MMTGHRPTWRYMLPDGLAFCTGCGRPITARQFGREVCPGKSPLGRKEGGAGDDSGIEGAATLATPEA
jgi:hypothetical protein